MKGIMLKDLYENFYIKKKPRILHIRSTVHRTYIDFYRYKICFYTLYDAFDYCFRFIYIGSIL